MFVLKLIIGLLQAPLRRIAELLGLDAGGAQPPPAPTPERADREVELTSPRARPSAPRPARRAPGQPLPSPRPPPASPRPPPASSRPPPASLRAKEVDEEPVLVAEFAEEGAEDGAGAEVHVDEPWEGYSRMRVPDLKDRLSGATTAELAAVQLYETRIASAFRCCRPSTNGYGPSLRSRPWHPLVTGAHTVHR